MKKKERLKELIEFNAIHLNNSNWNPIRNLTPSIPMSDNGVITWIGTMDKNGISKMDIRDDKGVEHCNNLTRDRGYKVGDTVKMW